MSLSVEEKKKDLSVDPEFIVDFSYLTFFASYLLFLFFEEGYQQHWVWSQNIRSKEEAPLLQICA